jgi:hypothetical protein
MTANGVIRYRLTGLKGAGPRRLYVGLRRSGIGLYTLKKVSGFPGHRESFVSDIPANLFFTVNGPMLNL